ncbi:unnamed protein product [Durusdinium trenchii]|uniref:Exostosin GT47 domain-containing protein n=1 Tax=Durusdinium trenchii TaxID=1381693 RepID=A0ABP0PRV9_9DINO
MPAPASTPVGAEEEDTALIEPSAGSAPATAPAAAASGGECDWLCRWLCRWRLCILLPLGVLIFFLGKEWNSLNLGISDSLPSNFSSSSLASAANAVSSAFTAVAPEASEDLQELLTKAVECLRLTTPELDGIKYPSDAEEHFLEVNRTLASFLPRHVPMHKWLLYQGPWIENFWINRFSQKWLERPRGTRLHEIFGPFIPIFVPFVDLKVMMKGKYPPGLMEALNRTLRRDCLYVTVSQHDEGLFGMPRGAERKQVDRIQQSSIPNLLVFSAGGYGHVPLPLLKQPEEPLPATPRLAQRPFFAGFVGGKNAPAVRTQMCDDVRSWADKNQKEVKFIFGYVKNWKDILQNSSLGLSPRGWGRNSFRTIELLQMGRIPVYVWSDEPWLFYRHLWDQEQIGFASHFTELPQTFDHIAADIHKLEAMEQRILELRESHFSFDGVIQQISQFLLGERTDLRCQRLPSRTN